MSDCWATRWILRSIWIQETASTLANGLWQRCLVAAEAIEATDLGAYQGWLGVGEKKNWEIGWAGVVTLLARERLTASPTPGCQVDVMSEAFAVRNVRELLRQFTLAHQYCRALFSHKSSCLFWPSNINFGHMKDAQDEMTLSEGLLASQVVCSNIARMYSLASSRRCPT